MDGLDEVQRSVSSAAFDATTPVNITDANGNIVSTPARGDLHRPGYRFPTPAIRDVREAVHQTRVAMIRDAWRSEPVDHTPVLDAEAAREEAYAEYCERLTNAWRAR
jgi:hypothetical protein